MSEFSGINNFGSLISKTSGQKISYDDLKEYDKNENGTIESSELSKAIKELQLDSVSFTKIDSNGDKSLSEDEFKLWEQKLEIQDAVNEKLQTVYDNAVLSKYFSQIKNELKTFMNSFISEYKGDTSNMVTEFKTQLESQFNTIKEEKLNNDPNFILNGVLDEMQASMLTEKDSSGNILSPTEVQVVLEGMEKVANNYIKTYKGSNLKTDLKAYLEEFFSKSDKEKLTDAANNFNNKVKDFGGYLSSNDFSQIKDAVKEFLQTAIEKGVVVKLGETNVASASAITSALAQFTDARSLMDAMKTTIEGLSSEPKKTQLVNNARAKLEQEEWKKFAGIKGSQYQINAGLIDYSKIPGYAKNEEAFYVKGAGKHGAREGAAKWLQDNLKEQCWKQIVEMLEKQGVSPEKAKTVFENVFSASSVEAAEQCVDGQHSTVFRSSKSWAYAKDLTDACLQIFNGKIATAIDEMNASYEDMDIIDIDFTVIDQTQDEEGNTTGAVKDGSGEAVAGLEEGETLADAYKTGKVLSVKKRGAEYYVTVAEQMVNGLRSQMLSKAKAMCSANGIKFDLGKFTAMFNSAKSIAVSLAVTGVTSEGESFGGMAASTMGSAVAVAGGGVGITAATYGLGSIATGIGAGATVSTVATVEAISALTGPVGIGIMSAVAIASAFLFGGHHSESNLDVRLLIDTFTESFKNNYSEWVKQEKSNAQNT